MFGTALKEEEIIQPTPADADIARGARMEPIRRLQARLGLQDDEFEEHGRFKGRVIQSDRLRQPPPSDASYVVVVGMTPTSAGEGKSTTTIGLAQALGAHLHTRAIACVRQPSQGPTFGVKGGAAGGGYSQVVPMEEFNLHLTGDIHAIGAAHNLVAAAIDTRRLHEGTQSDDALWRRIYTDRPFPDAVAQRRLSRLGLTADEVRTNSAAKSRFVRLDMDVERLQWNRVLDVSDRFLRGVEVGCGSGEAKFRRSTAFDITVASELMAVLALAADLADLQQRVRRVVFGHNKSGEPLTLDDLGVAGAVVALLRDTLKPTLMQTLENTPVLVHAGPFANIAHGNSSIIADRVALHLVGGGGVVLTEAGFGSDIGGEKFFDIKCRASGLVPTAAVLVVSVRAVKSHCVADDAADDLAKIRSGFANVDRHIRINRAFGVPVVVAVNRFPADSPAELALLEQLCKAAGAFDACVSTHHSHGGRGAVALAEALRNACKAPSQFRPLYDLALPLEEKIHFIVREVYGGSGAEFSETARAKLAEFTRLGYAGFPICMAKTQYSFSDNPDLKGAPSGFTVFVRDVRASVGAGFVYPLIGTISTIPGLPTRPVYYDIEVDPISGAIVGLS